MSVLVASTVLKPRREDRWLEVNSQRVVLGRVATGGRNQGQREGCGLQGVVLVSACSDC